MDFKKACQKAAMIAAEEPNRIAAQYDRRLKQARDWLTRMFPGIAHKWGEGPGERELQFQLGPRNHTAYSPIDTQGTEERTYHATDCDGSPVDIKALTLTSGDCEVPSNPVVFGYREVRGCYGERGAHFGPFCIKDLLLKKNGAFGKILELAREGISRDLSMGFNEELEARILNHAKYLVVSKFDGDGGGKILFGPRYSGRFPAIPDGGLDVGTIRHMKKRMVDEGYEGPFEVWTDEDAADFAIRMDKRQRNVTLMSEVKKNDGDFSDLMEYRGIHFKSIDFPPRYIVIPDGNGTYRLQRIYPETGIAGTRGVVEDLNGPYYSCQYRCNGVDYQVYQAAYIVGKKAARREDISLTHVGDSGKVYSGQVEIIGGSGERVIPDPMDCNKVIPNRLGLRRLLQATHGFYFIVPRPEQIAVILHKVSPACVCPVDPCCAPVEHGPGVVGQTRHPAKRKDCPDDCDKDIGPRLDPAPASCEPQEEMSPGIIRVSRCGEGYRFAPDAELVSLSVERQGGSKDKATAQYLIEIPGLEPQSGTLEWEDGDWNVRKIQVDLTNAQAGAEGRLTISNVTGATADEACLVAPIRIQNNEEEAS